MGVMCEDCLVRSELALLGLVVRPVVYGSTV